jgi:lipid-binding SYLF domain-containing protein
LFVGTLLAAGSVLAADKAVNPDRLQQKREAVDEVTNLTMDRLLTESPQARRLFDRSVGYAVFDNFHVAFLVSGGGGIGVAVDRETRGRTYMKMGTAGVGLGLGGQSYSLVFLFEDLETFRKFVRSGWHADTTASAAVGRKGAAAEASFTHGLAVYQLTNKGLIAHVGISGTRCWKDRRMNTPAAPPLHARAR